MPFLMASDKRARKVAKDLKALLLRHGMELSLGKCLDITSKMYGYADWRDLLAKLGDETSPDDVEAGLDEALRRRELQVMALVSAGLDPELADSIRGTLAATGRSERDVDARTNILRLPSIEEYHPWRLRRALIAPNSWMMEIIESFGDSTMDEVTPEDIREELVTWSYDWSMDQSLNPLDGALVDRDIHKGILECCDRVFEIASPIVDARQVIDSMWHRDVSSDQMPEGWDTWRIFHATYIHFGTNCFPSPFPGCGVEGCYVNFDGNGFFSFRFVVSPDLPAGKSAIDAKDHLSEGDIFYAARGIEIGFYPEHENVGRALEEPIHGLYTDEYFDVWTPFLRPVLNAAWNTLIAYASFSVPERNACCFEDEEPAVVRRYLRAVTDAEFEKATAAMSPSGKGILVHILGEGSHRPYVRERVDLGGEAARVLDPAAWSHHYLARALMSPEQDWRTHFFEMAKAMREEAWSGREGSNPWRADLNHLDIKIELVGLELEAPVDGLPKASEIIRVLELDQTDPFGAAYRAGVVAAVSGDHEVAKALVPHLLRDKSNAALMVLGIIGKLLPGLGADAASFKAAKRKNHHLAEELKAGHTDHYLTYGKGEWGDLDHEAVWMAVIASPAIHLIDT